MCPVRPTLSLLPLLSLLLAAQCAGHPALVEAPRAALVPATVRWSPTSVVEGTLFTISVEGGDPAVRTATGTFAGQPLHFAPNGGGILTAMAAAPLDSVGPLALQVQLFLLDSTTDARTLTVPVERGSYAMQRLTVAPEFGRPQPPEIQSRIAAEAARAREVSRRSHQTPRMWEPPFTAPRASRITSGFGHGRMYNTQVQSRHTGTDYAGVVGAPVVAPARAVVALVDDFYLGGGVVYLDHGASLVTAYLHLSAQLVAEGDTVEAGQVIGRIGASGRVTGPHLHWIVRYGSHTVDGLSLLNLPAALKD
jgi:murein DD-endopeptidase MepM/ murein hydrolase activator NlpD